MRTPAPFLLVLLVALSAIPVAGQDTDSAGVRIVGLQAARCTLGGGGTSGTCFDVSLTEDDAVLTADRGIDQGDGIILFLDNVRVVSDSDTMTTARLRYDRNAKTGRATGARPTTPLSSAQREDPITGRGTHTHGYRLEQQTLLR